MRQGPLQGVRVMDLGQVIAGPYAGMILADLGAEVIKLEDRDSRTGRREAYSTFDGESSLTIAMERNKKSIVVDLRKPQAKEVVHDLAKVADVFLDNFRAGVTERFGVDYATLSRLNPRIICCSITGYGSSGPYRDRPAFDPVAQAEGGLMSLTGSHPPEKLITGLVDMVTAMYAAQGIMAALYEREQTGKGQRVEVSLLGSAVSLLWNNVPEYSITGRIPGEGGRQNWSVALSGVYKTRDGDMALTIGGSHRFWPHLCRALGHPELEQDPRFDSISKRVQNINELVSLIQGLTRERPTAEWIDRMIEAGVPCGPVNTVREVVADPQVLQQQMVVPLAMGDGEVKVVGNPIKLSGMKPTYQGPPGLGQHTDDVLIGLLGYSRQKVDELRKLGVVS